ncbi:unnamed protein product [Acanthoscelides obtectus]|uniref:PiggyBac transposable element-derived protein domain-containing protein n=1 Tax=Acanthoscelides obtectus TaxID=200917 RepID=A0A9P0JZL1_ACAOB|nr:unnamed protein product [Acanthoscelides obtectus]CAK1669686.1 PiggyBac transposable element-derived protein 4 [Acanthoscelides obtectus]
MSQQIFQFLAQCLSLDDKNTRKERKEAYKFTHICEIWDHFVENCKSYYTPSDHCTVDEQLVGFRGRYPLIVYNQNKPDKYGVKIVMMNDSKTFYMINAIPYVGKVKVENKEPVPSYYVRKLAEPIYGTGRTITMYNWFTSIPLSDEILEHHQLTILGTRRKNKRELPPSLLTKKDVGKQSIIFGALGLQHIDTVPKTPAPRPKFKRTSKPTEKLSMLIEEQQLKKSREDKIKRNKLWKKAFTFRRDGKVYVSFRCGWCNSSLTKDAKECIECTGKKKSAMCSVKKSASTTTKDSTPGKVSKKSSTQVVGKKCTKPVSKDDSPNNKGQKKDSPTKASLKKVQGSQKGLRKGPQKRKNKIEIIEVTKKTGHVIKVSRCSNCSAFLSKDTKKCTKCIQRLQRRFETPHIAARLKKLTTRAVTKKQIKAKPERKPILKKKIKKEEEPIVMSCKLCKKGVRKAEEDYCYVCNYKDTMKMKKEDSGAAEKASPTSSRKSEAKCEDTEEQSTSNVLRLIHDNNQGMEISTRELTDSAVIEIVDVDDDEQEYCLTLSGIEALDDEN